MTEQSACVSCGKVLVGVRPFIFYQLRRIVDGLAQPGATWNLCSLSCLAQFVKGGDDA